MDFKETLRQIPLLTYAVRRARRLKHRLRRTSAVRSYFQDYSIHKLHIGSGIHILDGWLNVDLLPFDPNVYLLDGTKRFPFSDASFDFIFSEHMIEHMEYRDAHLMLRECYRVMKPGGRIRITTPDLSILTKLHEDSISSEAHEFINQYSNIWLSSHDQTNPAFVINDMFYNFGHKFIYDEQTLRHTLEQAGFRSVAKNRAGCSRIDAFIGVDEHANDYVGFITLAMEAVR